MMLSEIAAELGLELLNSQVEMGKEVTGGYVSDLLSDVMGNAREGELWITLQAHINVVAVASLKEMAAILLVKGIRPDPKMLQKATDEGIPVLGTSDGTFSAAGKLYALLVHS
jgi:predicted transcriptional regulator